MTNTELENCIARYGTAIYSFCRQLTRSSQMADDLYQDTFLKAMELNSNIDQTQNPKSYLLSIALRLWKNKKRKFAWRMRIAPMHPLSDGTGADTEISPESTPEEQLLKQEETDLVRQAVERLPDRLRIQTLLYYMEDLSTAEIAAVLKIPAGTVKSRLYQARIRLKKELEEILDEKTG